MPFENVDLNSLKINPSHRLTSSARSSGTKLLSDRPLSSYKLPSRQSGSNKNSVSTIRLFLPNGRSLDIDAKPRIVFGRKQNNSHVVDVDLSPYSGLELGVSRSHLLMQVTYTDVFVRDLGSSNGTFINGCELYSLRDYRLNDCDVLKLGQMKMRITLFS